MGIYDREYYRDERSSFLGTLARRGQMWKALVLINVTVYILQLVTARHGVDGPVTNWLKIDTDAILGGEVWRLLTGAFLHSRDWQHIVFNMLILWWAGSEVESIYGPREFLAFYLTAAVVASAVYVGVDALSHPAGERSTALGASGAVTAVLMLFALHFPNRTIYLFFVIPVPALLLVVLYVAFDAFGVLGLRPGENVGFAAHLGGAAFGFLYYKFQWRILNVWPSNWSISVPRPRPRLKVYRGEPEREPVVAAPARPMPDSQLEAELDAVLEKVARHGKSSLSEREQQILMRASEIYRNRRK
ncbi:MAG TPA: rhomboid family intramembrane serine protease [Gemmataceae bacterium]|jgi:membrane associated rhomboid family serine protease